MCACAGSHCTLRHPPLAGAHKHGPPSASERMGRLLSAVGQAHGATAVTQLLYELRSVLPQGEDEGADFGDRLWAQVRGLFVWPLRM